MTALEYLSLYKNELKVLPEGLFQGLTALEYLYLYDNELRALPAGLFQGLAALRWLNLIQNKLSFLPKDLFQGLTALKYLNLDCNHFGVFPFELFENLEALELGQPSLSGNFNFGPEGEIQTPAGIKVPSAKVVLARIKAEHLYKLDVLEWALGNAYPGLTFSDEQIKDLNKARAGATLVFQCFGKEGVPKDVGDFTLSLTGHHHSKPKW